MGTGNNAAAAAAQANADQQAAITNSVNQINNAYSNPNRQQQYQQYNTGLRDYYTTNVNNQEAVNARNLKFAMARSGLTGGSAAVDSNTQLMKDYTNGLLQATQTATAGTNALKQADINSKNQLISQAIQAGGTGAYPGAVAQSQSADLANAQNYGNSNALGNVFSNTAGIYNAEQTAAAERRAQYSPFGGLYHG